MSRENSEDRDFSLMDQYRHSNHQDLARVWRWGQRQDSVEDRKMASWRSQTSSMGSDNICSQMDSVSRLLHLVNQLLDLDSRRLASHSLFLDLDSPLHHKVSPVDLVKNRKFLHLHHRSLQPHRHLSDSRACSMAIPDLVSLQRRMRTFRSVDQPPKWRTALVEV